MTLIEQAKVVCDRLAPLGWRDLLQRVTNGQLDISQPNLGALRQTLLKPLSVVDRKIPGFSDFSLKGNRAIAPRSPATSLLYHSLASPGVTEGIDGFPTLADIEVIENLVFGIDPVSVDQLAVELELGANERFSIVVFAYEYRPAKDTCARVQADLAFSRCGVARVGTRESRWDDRDRGYQSEVNNDPFAFHVCPARYGAFLSVLTPGNRSGHMRPQAGDDTLQFLSPVHKLYAGNECLAGIDVTVEWTAFHYNDKIRRTREIALGMPNQPDDEPFVLVDLATITNGTVTPVPRPRLIEPATLDGKPLTFPVPRSTSSFAALEPKARVRDDMEVRSAPAYVHARTQLSSSGAQTDLNDSPDLLARVRAGNYNALHYVDFTGDGYVEANIATVAAHPRVNEQSAPAYSLLAAPDFFPSSGQRELFEMVPASFWGVPPRPLCDTRLPANLQAPHNRFTPTDKTMTTVVPMNAAVSIGPLRPTSADVSRHSCLPDDAAGVFAPGWDVSTDVDDTDTHHLAAYGLGSPFPEDAKLCAALSAFWPAVAPDAARTMSSHTGNPNLQGTVAPLSDPEVGQQPPGIPWDGVIGPRLVEVEGEPFVEYESFLHVDYVETALTGRFSSRLTGRIGTKIYAERMTALHAVYAHRREDRNQLLVLSFSHVSSHDSELQRAQNDSATLLQQPVYRVSLLQARRARERPHPSDHRKVLLPAPSVDFYFVEPATGIVLHRRSNQSLWRRLSAQ